MTTSKTLLLFIFLSKGSIFFNQSKLDSLLGRLDPQKLAASVANKSKKMEDALVVKSLNVLDKVQKQEEKIYPKLLSKNNSLQAKLRQHEQNLIEVLKISPKCRYTKFDYKIIEAPYHTFGYDIYADSKLLIHQINIPGLPGNNGFKTKNAAIKIAKLAIDKLVKGEFPPAISILEMKKLSIF